MPLIAKIKPYNETIKAGHFRCPLNDKVIEWNECAIFESR